MGEVGTLKELGVGVGDVIRIQKGFGGFENYAVKHSQRDFFVNDHGGADSEDGEYNFSHNCGHVFRLISRAPTSPKLWRDMTPEEKGELLLAAHEGKVMQAHCDNNGWVTIYPSWDADLAYRTKPEPKVETVTAYYRMNCEGKMVIDTHDNCGEKGVHRITFQTIDGKPDCASVNMEEV